MKGESKANSAVQGTAQADFERMAEINREIGLDALLRSAGSGEHEHGTPDEKAEVRIHHEDDNVRVKEE